MQIGRVGNFHHLVHCAMKSADVSNFHHVIAVAVRIEQRKRSCLVNETYCLLT